MQLFHFSEDGDIRQFQPRPVLKAAPRRQGQEWLNGPLVWAIAQTHQRLYLFPRECPRIVIWPHEHSTSEDKAQWLNALPDGALAVAYVETAWAARLQAARIHRYELPADTFESLEDAGMYVSRQAVQPLRRDLLVDLPQALAECGTELRIVDSLQPLRGVWDSSLHASGIRLRNAASWA
ncbi:DUF6886 family protein [Delftia acidovorans]|uniref:DUF6886 family protein n=1 Tax=Delftia acidovorans TaxID=80866 RepID=UPI0028B1A29F|nr:DUF6886 family protein [Delftia acidovorans]